MIMAAPVWDFMCCARRCTVDMACGDTSKMGGDGGSVDGIWQTGVGLGERTWRRSSGGDMSMSCSRQELGVWWRMCTGRASRNSWRRKMVGCSSERSEDRVEWYAILGWSILFFCMDCNWGLASKSSTFWGVVPKRERALSMILIIRPSPGPSSARL